MQNVNRYIDGNKGDPEFARAYREGLIFLMINFADKYYRTNDARGQDNGISGEPLSFNQKRRFRNEIYQIASENVKTHNEELKAAQSRGERTDESEIHLYDKDVIVNAFFDSSIGRVYADKRNDWLTISSETTGQQRAINTYMNNVYKASLGQDAHTENKEFMFIVSPYDPSFVDADAFKNAGEDQIGYIRGKCVKDKNGREQRQFMTGSVVNGNIVSVVPGNGYGIGDVTNPEVVEAVFGWKKDAQGRFIKEPDETGKSVFVKNRPPVKMYGPEFESGYPLIDRYIKKNNKKQEIRKFLSEQMISHAETKKFRADGSEITDKDTVQSGEEIREVSIQGRTQAPEEYEFMAQMCGYLDEKGIDFDIEVKDNKLVAKLNSRYEIRLLDRDDPKYRGRIYDNGILVRLGRASSPNEPDDETETIDKLITNDDCMAVVKYYLGGDDVRVDVSSLKDMRIADINKLERLHIGEQGIYPDKLPFERSGNAANQVAHRTVHAVPGRSSSNALLQSVKKYNYNGQDKHTDMKIMIRPSRVADEDDLPSSEFAKSLKVTQYSFGTSAAEDTEKRVNIRLRFPENKIFPEDLAVSEEFASYTDENGEVQPLTLMKPGSEISPEHVQYYYHLSAREELNRWVESAKSAHAAAVNIDDVISEFEVHGDDPAYDYPSPEDRDVADLQGLYWNILSGSTRSVKIFGEDEPIDAGETQEDRIRVIRQHYAAFAEDYFGSVPEIVREGLAVENHGTGIVPEHVVKYVNTSNSYGDQRNISYIEHMLAAMGEDYSPSFVKGDSYQAMITKNKMLRYKQNGAKEVANFTWGQIHNITGRTNEISPDRLKAVKGLEDKPVTRNVLGHAMETLIRSGCIPESTRIAIDENGIIAYKCVIPLKSDVKGLVNGNNPDSDSKNWSDNKLYKTIQGSIGQLIEPGRYGEIVLKSVEGPDKVMIPGYDAYFVDPDPENPQSRLERLRLVGYEQRMCEAITRELHEAVYTIASEYNFVPHSTDLNKVYRNLTATPHDPEDFYARLPKDPENPTPEESVYLAILKTETQRCRFPTEYIDGATTMYQSMLNNPNTEDAKNYDYYYGDKCVSNMRCIGPDLYPVFDPDATGTAKNQGIVTYLREGISVDSSTNKPVGTATGRCALMNHEFMKDSHHDPFTRKTMCFNTAMSSDDYALNTGVALLTLNGYNFDDAFVVSKNFAETYKVKGTDGKMRNLKEGDKISDKHGNKGVISRVIDPEWALDEMAKNVKIALNDDNTGGRAGIDIMGEFKQFDVKFDENSKLSHDMQAAQQIQKALDIEHLNDIAILFRDNPNLSVVGSPYSPLSRYNGGTIREMMRSPDDLIIDKTDENGNKIKTTVKGGMGHLDIMITDMTVDVKSHIYDEEALLEGKGRKASAQLAWTIQSRGANFIMRESYNTNTSGINNLREYHIAIGLDIDPNTRILSEYTPQPNEQRKLIKLPTDDCPIKEKTINNKRTMKIDPSFFVDKRSEMLSKLNQSGGFMELPFQLDFKTRSYTNMGEGSKKYLLPATGQTYSVNGVEKPTYGMPVLPPELRSGQELHDGTTKAHDYTNRYVSVYKQALLYMGCEQMLAEWEKDPTKADKCKLLRDTMQNAKSMAQSEFDKVVSDLAENKFNDKYNVYTEGIMSNRLSKSATSVWTPDPHLRINEVGMSTGHAAQLGLIDRDNKLRRDAAILTWRDPCLNSGNARWMKVKIMDHLTGIAIHPLADKSFDGDFDGDAAGEKALQTKEARWEAERKFSHAANLLDDGTLETVVDKNGVEHVVSPLYIQSGMDVAANAYHKDKSIHDDFVQLTIDVNAMENAYKKDPDNYKCGFADNKNLVGEDALHADREYYCNKLADWCDRALNGIAVDHLIVENEQTVVSSLQRMVDSKAKGDAAKLRQACNNAGIDFECDENGRIKMDTVKNIVDEKGNIVTKDELNHTDVEANLDNQALTAYKTDDTAHAGVVSKSGVQAVRDKGPEVLNATLNTTYRITQATLQSKKDSAEALSKDTILKTFNRDVFDGYKLTGFKHDTKNPNNVSESFEELNSTKHVRITEKQPKVTYVNGKPEFETDKNGKIVMVDKPKRCTEAEYIYQVNAVLKAYGIKDMNPENVRLMAESMIITEKTYDPKDIERVNNGSLGIEYLRPKIERNVCGGFATCADRQGSLLDRAGYGQHLSALVKEAESDITRKQSIFRSIDTKAVDIMDVQSKIDAATKKYKASDRTDKNALREMRQEEHNLREIYKTLPNSAAFAPTSLVKNVAAYNKGDLEHFKPMGRQDAFVTEKDQKKGYGIMGESQEDYTVRMNALTVAEAGLSVKVNDASLDDQPISAIRNVNIRGAESVRNVVDTDNPFEYSASHESDEHKIPV